MKSMNGMLLEEHHLGKKILIEKDYIMNQRLFNENIDFIFNNNNNNYYNFIKKNL